MRQASAPQSMALGQTVVETTYTYDANGNVTSETEDGVTTEHDYDFENKLIQTTLRAGADNRTEITYAYDAGGIRTSKTTVEYEAGVAQPAVETFYIVDKQRPYAQVVEERNGADGSLIVSYTHGLDLISQTDGASQTTSYYLTDGQLSTRALTDGSGSLTDTYTYDAFGELEPIWSAGDPTANSYLYTGEQLDADTDQYYLRARYYQPGVGRFTSMDPFEGILEDPFTLHRYFYARGNPILYNDPSGNFAAIGTLGAISVQNILAGVQAFSGRAAMFATQSALMGLNLKQTLLAFAADEAAGFAAGVVITAAVALTSAALSQAVSRSFRALSRQGIKAGKFRIARNATGHNRPLPKEIKIGQTLSDELGYDVLMRARYHKSGDATVRSPKGVLTRAEFKTLEVPTANRLDKSLREGRTQIRKAPFPSMIVLDARGIGFPPHEAEAVLDKYMRLRQIRDVPQITDVLLITDTGFVWR